MCVEMSVLPDILATDSDLDSDYDEDTGDVSCSLPLHDCN